MTAQGCRKAPKIVSPICSKALNNNNNNHNNNNNTTWFAFQRFKNKIKAAFGSISIRLTFKFSSSDDSDKYRTQKEDNLSEKILVQPFDDVKNQNVKSKESWISKASSSSTLYAGKPDIRNEPKKFLLCGARRKHSCSEGQS